MDAEDSEQGKKVLRDKKDEGDQGSTTGVRSKYYSV
jgi:hypothetical protein